MKIAYVVDSVEGGGVALPIPEITRVLRNAGAHVEVFALTKRDGRALPGMLADGLTVHVREGSAHNLLAAYSWLNKELVAYQPTLIWTSLSRATIVGILSGWRHAIPLVCWQHSAALKPFRRFILYVLRKRPAMWIGDSQMVADVTAKRFNVPPEKMATWSLFSAKPCAPQAQPWQEGQPLRLGSLGRLHPSKAYDVLIEALAVLKQRGFKAPVPVELTIAGDGREHDALIDAAINAGFDGLHLIGYTNNPYDFLAELHLYVHPSRAEGFCIAVHEAMQAGLPVIATTVGQIPYTVEAGRSGWLVPPLNVEALADALAEALANPEKLASMGQAARNRVLPLYSEEVFRQAGESILNRLKAQGVLP